MNPWAIFKGLSLGRPPMWALCICSWTSQNFKIFQQTVEELGNTAQYYSPTSKIPRRVFPLSSTTGIGKTRLTSSLVHCWFVYILSMAILHYRNSGEEL